MRTVPSALNSEFKAVERQNNYRTWLRLKIAASLADPWTAIAHDDVMAEMDTLINNIEIGQSKA